MCGEITSTSHSIVQYAQREYGPVAPVIKAHRTQVLLQYHANKELSNVCQHPYNRPVNDKLTIFINSI